MRRAILLCLALAVPLFVMSQAGSEQNNPNVFKGKYAFTLTEKCVHQLSANVPGFDSTTLAIVDPVGAETYSGASDGLMIFDGQGGVTVKQAHATNIMNAANRLIQPIITPIPLGFGIGTDLPFTCTGNYTVASSKINMTMTCNATLPQPNVFNASGFSSQFNMRGWVPESTDHAVVTDPGANVQPVTIFINGGGMAQQQRICTRSTSLVLVSK